MREIRTSGSEGGAGRKPRSYLYPGWLLGHYSVEASSFASSYGGLDEGLAVGILFLGVGKVGGGVGVGGG